jgi:hypothetical protein
MANTKKPKSVSPSQKRIQGLALLSFCAATLLCILIAYTCGLRIWYGPWNSAADFGQSFGLLETLFSGAAMILVLATLALTRHQVHLSLTTIDQVSAQLRIQLYIAYLANDNRGKNDPEVVQRIGKLLHDQILESLSVDDQRASQ